MQHKRNNYSKILHINDKACAQAPADTTRSYSSVLTSSCYFVAKLNSPYDPSKHKTLVKSVCPADVWLYSNSNTAVLLGVNWPHHILLCGGAGGGHGDKQRNIGHILYPGWRLVQTSQSSGSWLGQPSEKTSWKQQSGGNCSPSQTLLPGELQIRLRVLSLLNRRWVAELHQR